MRIELDGSVRGSAPRQHIAAIAVLVDPGKPALCRIQRSRCGPLNTETKKNVPAAVRGDRRIDEYRGVKAREVGLVIRQTGVKHSLNGSAVAARIGNYR